jgi:hypothetical protein
MWKSIFLVTILAFLLFCCALIYTKIVQEDNIIETENKTLAQFHDYSKKNEVVSENDFNIKVLYFEEKYNSINKRFDDLYILGSMIVLLLITINVGLFINTQNKVDKYFNENFDTHRLKIENFEKDAGLAYGKILALLKNTQSATEQTTAPNNTQEPIIP